MKGVHKINSGGRTSTLNCLAVCVNKIKQKHHLSTCFYTHINKRGIDIVGVLLSSFDWNDHSVELICPE